MEILISLSIVSLLIGVLGQTTDESTVETTEKPVYQSFMKKLEELSTKVDKTVSNRCRKRMKCSKVLLDKFTNEEVKILEEMVKAFLKDDLNKADELAMQINKQLCCGYWAVTRCMTRKVTVCLG